MTIMNLAQTGFCCSM